MPDRRWFSAPPLVTAHCSGRCLTDAAGGWCTVCPIRRVLSAPKAGAHQGIDNQRNHELGASQCPLKIPVALPGSVLTSLLPGVSDRNLLILLIFVFCHGFRPAWGFVTVLPRLT